VRIYTYVNYGGNCRQAFEFYAEHLRDRFGTSWMLLHEA